MLGVPCDFEAPALKRTYRALSLRLHPDRAGGSTEHFARAAAAYDCLTDAACKGQFDEGAEIEGWRPSLAEAVERHYYPQRFPYEPFGDPFERQRGATDADAQRRERSRQRQRTRAGVRNETDGGGLGAALPGESVPEEGAGGGADKEEL